MSFKKISGCLLMFLMFFVLFFQSPVWAAKNYLQKELGSIYKLYEAKKFDALLKKMKKLSPGDLKELHLFLTAECLKATGDKVGAIKSYGELMKKFPETEVAAMARFTHFVLMVESATNKDVRRFQGLAKTLPTSWQRGKAFEKLLEIKDLAETQKSRMALSALREYASEKPFYRGSPEAVPLLKVIISKNETFLFTGDEWFEILKLAIDEGLGKEVFAKKTLFSRKLGAWGNDAITVFEAKYLNSQKKNDRAISILNSLVKRKLSHPALKSYAFQVRGDINYFALKYSDAVSDYRKVLQNPVFPVDRRAAEYRLMRATFKVGKLSESLELVNRLSKTKNPEGLLPGHVYDMALELYDAGKKLDSVPFFMALSRKFPWHYRADDAIGYSIMALGSQTKEGKALFKILKSKYANSFFISWISPKEISSPMKFGSSKVKKASRKIRNRTKVWKILMNSGFSSIASEEMRKLTNKDPLDLSLFKTVISIAEEANDYNLLSAYGERLLRRLLENGKGASDMPDWGWRAFYPRAFWKQVKSQSSKYSISPHWILSIMREESHFNPKTLSRSNAMGLMQILPSTGKWIAQKLNVKRFRQNSLWDPETNIKFGCWYLKYLSDMFKGDLHLASASYNGGQGNVLRKVEKGPHSHLPVFERLDRIPLPETRDYYKKVMGSCWNYDRLYK